MRIRGRNTCLLLLRFDQFFSYFTECVRGVCLFRGPRSTQLPNIRSMSCNELENTNNAMYRHEIFSYIVRNMFGAHFFFNFPVTYDGASNLVAICTSSQIEVTPLTLKGIKNMRIPTRFVSSPHNTHTHIFMSLYKYVYTSMKDFRLNNPFDVNIWCGGCQNFL